MRYGLKLTIEALFDYSTRSHRGMRIFLWGFFEYYFTSSPSYPRRPPPPPDPTFSIENNVYIFNKFAPLIDGNMYQFFKIANSDFYIRRLVFCQGCREAILVKRSLRICFFFGGGGCFRGPLFFFLKLMKYDYINERYRAVCQNAP